jgi:hypothetical protein
MNATVAGAPLVRERLGPVGMTRWVPSARTHSGQRCPTVASIEHAAQMGRSHLLHRSNV